MRLDVWQLKKTQKWLLSKRTSSWEHGSYIGLVSPSQLSSVLSLYPHIMCKLSQESKQDQFNPWPPSSLADRMTQAVSVKKGPLSTLACDVGLINFTFSSQNGAKLGFCVPLFVSQHLTSGEG